MQTIAGQDIPADLVIYATGYDRNYDYLAKDVLKALHQTDEGIPLYRDTIPTDVQVSIVSVHVHSKAPCGPLWSTKTRHSKPAGNTMQTVKDTLSPAWCQSTIGEQQQSGLALLPFPYLLCTS